MIDNSLFLFLVSHSLELLSMFIKDTSCFPEGIWYCITCITTSTFSTVTVTIYEIPEQIWYFPYACHKSKWSIPAESSIFYITQIYVWMRQHQANYSISALHPLYSVYSLLLLSNLTDFKQPGNSCTASCISFCKGQVSSAFYINWITSVTSEHLQNC